MKAFTNITLGQLNEAINKLNSLPNTIPCWCLEDRDYIQWDGFAEYFDFWRSEYDNEDIDFVCDHVFINTENDYIYVLEVQENEYGNEELVIETLYA